MKLEPLSPEFIKALPVLQTIQEAGFEAYFVGGCVRDFLLKQPIHDVDIATSATPYEIATLFPKTFDLGIQHGTIAVLLNHETYEITTFRTESGYQDFRRPDKVEFVRSLKEDLKRRDFTMNALAVSYDGTLVDLFSGLADLKQGLIRAVGNPHERFFEDALRMMRGVRFASQLGFEIEGETFAAIKEHHQLLENIAVERIRVEFEKLLLGQHAAFGLSAFIASELYRYTPGLTTAAQPLEELLRHLQPTITDETVAWSLLLAFVAPQEPRKFLQSWKLSNQRIKEVQLLLHYLPQRQQGLLPPLALYHLGLPLAVKLEELISHWGLTPEIFKLTQDYQGLPIKNRQSLAINGGDLLAAFPLGAGPWIAESLQLVEEKVVTALWLNEKDYLLQHLEEELRWKKILS